MYANNSHLYHWHTKSNPLRSLSYVLLILFQSEIFYIHIFWVLSLSTVITIIWSNYIIQLKKKNRPLHSARKNTTYNCSILCVMYVIQMHMYTECVKNYAMFNVFLPRSLLNLCPQLNIFLFLSKQRLLTFLILLAIKCSFCLNYCEKWSERSA